MLKVHSRGANTSQVRRSGQRVLEHCISLLATIAKYRSLRVTLNRDLSLTAPEAGRSIKYINKINKPCKISASLEIKVFLRSLT